MDDELRAIAQMIRQSMPCSIQLPAGAGKTQIVAALAVAVTELGERPLVLTHTNAGVDVLRRRLCRFGISGSAVRVDTIASWSFDLVRHYPLLSGVSVPEEPDWTRSKEYYSGAAAAVQAAAIRAVLRASYRLVIVDEYQDCIIEQHDLIAAIAESLPVCVFGDPLRTSSASETTSPSAGPTKLWPFGPPFPCRSSRGAGSATTRSSASG